MGPLKKGALAFFFVFFVISLVGPASSQESDITSGGTITILDISQFNTSSQWVGYYGNLYIRSDPTAGWLLISNLSYTENVTEQNVPIACNKLSGYLLISNESKVPDLEDLVPGDLTVLDGYFVGDVDSATKTFKRRSTFDIAGNTITNAPTAYTNVRNRSQTTSFREGYLTDGDAFVFVAVIDQATEGFDGSLHDFQFILPRAFADYYIFGLFNCKWCGDDICSSSEDCDDCPDDCGECEDIDETDEEPVYVDLIPSGPPVLEPEPRVDISLWLENNLLTIGDIIEGTVIVRYWGAEEVRTTLVIELEGIEEQRHTLFLAPPFSEIEVDFEFVVTRPGNYNVIAYLEGGLDGIIGRKRTAGGFGTTCPSGVDCPYQVKVVEKNIPCTVFGISCICWIIVLLLVVVLLLYMLINPKRKKRRPKESRRNIMERMWLAKDSITGRAKR